MRQGTSFLCEMWCGSGTPFLKGLYGLPPILKGLYPSLPLGCCCATFSSSWVLMPSLGRVWVAFKLSTEVKGDNRPTLTEQDCEIKRAVSRHT